MQAVLPPPVPPTGRIPAAGVAKLVPGGTERSSGRIFWPYGLGLLALACVLGLAYYVTTNKVPINARLADQKLATSAVAPLPAIVTETPPATVIAERTRVSNDEPLPVKAASRVIAIAVKEPKKVAKRASRRDQGNKKPEVSIKTSPRPVSAPARSVVSTPAPAPVPSAPEPGDSPATLKIRAILADYYGDVFSPPVLASRYFAPQVERFFSHRNVPLAEIEGYLIQSVMTDVDHPVYQIEPGSLRVSDPAKDGSRTAKYTEACRLFRVSKGKYQRLRTQVRVRFDSDYRISYFSQEKLLENVLE